MQRYEFDVIPLKMDRTETIFRAFHENHLQTLVVTFLVLCSMISVNQIKTLRYFFESCIERKEIL